MGVVLSLLETPIPAGGYELYRTFPGHTMPINCMRFSPDGSLLASGGDDSRVRIWSLRGNGVCVQTLTCTRNGSVTDIRWNAEGSDLQLFFGCADGTVHIYQRASETGADFKPILLFVAHRRAIEALDYDPGHGRLATVAGGSLSVWSAEEGERCIMQMQLIGQTASDGFLARSVHFTEGGKAVVVSFLDSHEIMAWSIEPWKLLWRSQAFTRIGNTAISADGEHILVDNLATGVDAYKLPQMARKATYQATSSTHLFPKQVAFGARDSHVIYGSENGCVYIFDFASAETFQILRHQDSSTAIVQTLATYSDLGVHYIASGLSVRDYSIKIWMKRKGKVVRIQEPASSQSDWNIPWVSIFVWLCLLCAVLPRSGLLENMPGRSHNSTFIL